VQVAEKLCLAAVFAWEWGTTRNDIRIIF